MPHHLRAKLDSFGFTLTLLALGTPAAIIALILATTHGGAL